MDKYIKIEYELWKKLKLVSAIDVTSIKAVANNYISKGLKKRLKGSPEAIKDLKRIVGK